MPSVFPVESRGLSPHHLTVLRDFKALLKRVGAFDEARFDDHDLARFLKARNWDATAARHMWESMLVWRRENRADTINTWFVFHERQEYDKLYPTGLHKTDKKGHPVLVQKLGRVNIGALYKLTSDERLRLAHIAECEHLRKVVFPVCSRHAGRHVDQLFTIIDLDGVAFTSVMRVTSLLKMFMQMDSNNYPETLHHMTIINAPGWFATSWGAVKSVLSGDTVKKIEILGKDFQETLLRHIAPENLLREYGGSSEGAVTDNTGPWQHPQPEPELVPEPVPEMPAPDVEAGGPAPMDVDAAPRAHAGHAHAAGPSGRDTPAPLRPGSPPLGPSRGQPQQQQHGVGRQPSPARRLHEPPLLPLQGDQVSPAASSTGSSGSCSMAAPLLSNFHATSSQPDLGEGAEPGAVGAGEGGPLEGGSGSNTPPRPGAVAPGLAGRVPSISGAPATATAAAALRGAASPSPGHSASKAPHPQPQPAGLLGAEYDAAFSVALSGPVAGSSAGHSAPQSPMPRGSGGSGGQQPPLLAPAGSSSGMTTATSTLVGMASATSLQLSLSQPQQQDDDAESVRMSAMSQRSYYSAMSHADFSSVHSGATSHGGEPGSDQARRWSLQREMHAAAVAQAVAATELRRTATAAAAAVTAAAAGAPGPAASGPPLVYRNQPPAAQQGFGSWLDQPPRYDPQGPGGLGGMSPHGSSLERPSADLRDMPVLEHPEEGCDPQSPSMRGRTRERDASANGARRGGHGHVALSVEPGSGAERGVVPDECGLGVTWARNWFRRRQYKQLEPEPQQAGGAGGGGHRRNGSAGGLLAPGSNPYSSISDALDPSAPHQSNTTTSPSKMLPKPPGGGRHMRGDSWEWDQPSPMTDQAFGAMQRDLSPGRSERRRLLRSDSPSRGMALLDNCMHCRCCTIM